MHPFEEAGELVRSMTPPELGTVRYRAHRHGVKLWFDAEKPTRHHYEAQRLARRHVDGSEGVVLEVGFHAEHGDLAVNDAAITAIAGAQASWRDELGTEVELGGFYGRPDDWRRASEIWFQDIDDDDPEIGFEIATRLVDYISVIEPLIERGV